MIDVTESVSCLNMRPGENLLDFKKIQTSLFIQPRFTKLLLIQRMCSVSPVVIGRCRGRTELKLWCVCVRCKGMHIAGHMQTDCTQTEKGQSCPRAAYEITANDCICSAYLFG